MKAENSFQLRVVGVPFRMCQLLHGDPGRTGAQARRAVSYYKHCGYHESLDDCTRSTCTVVDTGMFCSKGTRSNLQCGLGRNHEPSPSKRALLFEIF